jgi:hypothetical protein
MGAYELSFGLVEVSVIAILLSNGAAGRGSACDDGGHFSRECGREMVTVESKGEIGGWI